MTIPLPIAGGYQFWWQPEDFGTIGIGEDGALINAAIQHAQGNGGGMVCLPNSYVIEQSVVVPSGAPIIFLFTGGFNRQSSPGSFFGGNIRPANNFPTNTPLFVVGTSGNATTNPNGTKFFNLKLNGQSPNGTNITGCVGLQINDTSDVHLIEPDLSNFDRTGATGTAINGTSTATGSCAGFTIYGGIISTSWRGLYLDGTGFTDGRIINLLEHQNTQGITLGPTAGGGGFQISNCHFVYVGAPAAAWRFSNGAQAGDYVINGNYFDQSGSGQHCKLANAKGAFTDNHFLPAASANGALVTVSTASQELNFSDNHANANGSSMTSLLQTTAHAGAPTEGVYIGNSVYGSPGGSFVGVLIDSAATVIPATSTATTYVQGNVSGA